MHGIRTWLRNSMFQMCNHDLVRDRPDDMQCSRCNGCTSQRPLPFQQRAWEALMSDTEPGRHIADVYMLRNTAINYNNFIDAILCYSFPYTPQQTSDCPLPPFTWLCAVFGL